MRREYQITIDFEMDNYDEFQERDEMLKFLRIVMEYYADPDTVFIRTEKGAEALPK